jgi:hypothetical protein
MRTASVLVLVGSVLASLDEGTTWRISGVQVQISPSFLPKGPLETWHDTEPFAPAPPEPEPEADEAEAA